MKEESNLMEIIMWVVIGGFFIFGIIGLELGIFKVVAPIVIGILFLYLLYELFTTIKNYLQIQIENQIWNKKWLVDQSKIKRQIFEATSTPLSFDALCTQLQQNQPQDSADSIEISLMEMVKDGILIYSQDGYMHKSLSLS